MSTVYVVMDDCCGGCGRLYEVFTQRLSAEAYIALMQPKVSHTLRVDECELDPIELFWEGKPVPFLKEDA